MSTKQELKQALDLVEALQARVRELEDRELELIHDRNEERLNCDEAQRERDEALAALASWWRRSTKRKPRRNGAMTLRHPS